MLNDYNQLVASLIRKVKLNARLSYTLAFLMFLTGQLFHVLAFFLPLKVLILLGSEGVPSYLQDFVAQEEKNAFIVFLASGALASYLAYVMLDYGVSSLVSNISNKMAAKAQKLTIYSNQEVLAKDLVLRLIRSRATYFMIICGFVLGMLIEWRLFFPLIIMLYAEYYLFSVKWKKYSQPAFLADRQRFISNRSLIFTIVSSINFFVGFCALFYLVYKGYISNLLLAVFLILLIRQIFQRLLVAVQDGITLYTNKEKIVAIFYARKSVPKESKKLHDKIESFISHPSIKSYFISQYDLDDSFEWTDINQPQAALLKVNSLQKSNKQLWLKLFMQNRSTEFEQEADFICNIPCEGLKSSKLISKGKVRGLLYLLYDTPALHELEEKELKKHRGQLLFDMLKLVPESKFSSRVSRTFPPLTERLTKAKLEEIHVALKGAPDSIQLEKVLETYEKLSEYLNDIPLSIMNKELGSHNVRITELGSPTLVNWHKVTLEPLCSGIPWKQIKHYVDFEDLIVFLNNCRDDCNHLTANHLRLSALLGELERNIQKRHFKHCIQILSPILDCLNELDKSIPLRKRK